ncbi:sigma-54-dependent Fis family transcriptional regulator [uncultured Methylibium sp.]|uniref:sigma-54-dependent Fis family transcriptional regulator n=1 Tax=uncultured Methylibium sp. TaxID=381093 RepID=UPI0025E66711|nr:sigma-54-dependent Fis family transcriptional regulator [uncultured Methylibium sp.]
MPLRQHRQDQREHIATVMQVAEAGLAADAARKHDQIIRASWSRCVHEHRLDPTRMQEAVILPSHQLREHQDRIEDFLHIARHGLETLYQQVAGLGYCVLLTDARGVTVDFIGDLQLDASLRKAGLYLGADWSEQHAGTCGVGTCISTGESLTVHLDDHFDATHIPLTCTTAPVYDAQGKLNAVLDISQLSSAQPKASQHLALQLVRTYAQHIEDASFLHSHRHAWILRLSAAPAFLDVNPDYLLALDDAGRVIGHNRRAQLLLEAQWKQAGVGSVIGLPFERLFNATLAELGRYTLPRANDQRAITLSGSGRVLFMLASPPPRREHGLSAAAPQPQAGSERRIPKPLAALSGGDPALDRQIERAAKLVNSPVSVLLTGETGSGKEYFAKALHQASERRGRPFVAVNCAAIPETLIESELFGHLPGSFSGAGPKAKKGLIQEADGGTLFLDEIGDMPRDLQARLLRVLAEREVLPIGATRPTPVNIRVIAATHCDLEALVRERRFRDDLYYRLNGAHIVLPPLRERRDLAWLIQRMLGECAKAAGRSEAPRLSSEASERLHAHAWPGNLRELRNVIDFACAVCGEDSIALGDLPDGMAATEPAVARAATAPVDPAAGADPVARLREALQASGGNVSAAARRLGISRMTLYRRLRQAGLAAPPRGGDPPAD